MAFNLSQGVLLLRTSSLSWWESHLTVSKLLESVALSSEDSLLPEFTPEITSIKTSILMWDQMYGSLPKSIYAYRATADLPHEHGWLSYAGHKLEELWSKIKNENLVYRAIPDAPTFALELYHKTRVPTDIYSHFGPGFCYTKRYDLACLSAGFGGVILVHRYIPRKQVFEIRELRNAEWDECVRWNMGHPNPHLKGKLRQVEIKADFIAGSVAEDAWDGFCGRELVETGVWLMGAMTKRAREHMMEHLEAVIFLDLQPDEIRVESKILTAPLLSPKVG